MENLLAVVPGRTQASFYRTSAGAEVDLVLELPGMLGNGSCNLEPHCLDPDG